MLARAGPGPRHTLPSADEPVLFQRAGIHWDLAMLAMQQGQLAAAVTEATEAATHYERGGFEPQLLNARLLIAEHGTTDEKPLEELQEPPQDHDQWHRTGWLLADRLRPQGRDHEASTLEARLTAG